MTVKCTPSVLPTDKAWRLLDACRYPAAEPYPHDKGTPVLVGFEFTCDMIAGLVRERDEARAHADAQSADAETLRSIAYYMHLWVDGDNAAHSLGHVRSTVAEPLTGGAKPPIREEILQPISDEKWKRMEPAATLRMKAALMRGQAARRGAVDWPGRNVGAVKHETDCLEAEAAELEKQADALEPRPANPTVGDRVAIGNTGEHGVILAEEMFWVVKPDRGSPVRIPASGRTACGSSVEYGLKEPSVDPLTARSLADLLCRLDEAGATGCDLSPGDAFAVEAAIAIRRLLEARR